MSNSHSLPNFSSYNKKPDGRRRRVLMLSEINTIPFLEVTFNNHPDYDVVNESLEAILKMGVQTFIQKVVSDIEAKLYDFDGIAGFFNTPNAIACVLSHMTGKTSTSIESVIRCQSKLEARRQQKISIREYTPGFITSTSVLEKGSTNFPLFTKPIRGSRSFSSFRVSNIDDLQRLTTYDLNMLKEHNQPYIDAIQLATNDPELLEIARTSNEYICEEIIMGDQYAIDGYVYNGEVFYHGIVKEVLLPSSVSFERHEFPAELPENTISQLRNLTERLISQTGLNNTEFDIEVAIDSKTNKIQIFEMNPYAVSQYENMFTLAGGDQMMATICALACGDPPPVRTEPQYRFCYSCELRTYEDQVICRVPTADEIKHVENKFPHVRVVNRVPPGARKLSDFRQTEDSFRYCIISIPGASPKQIFDKLDQIKTLLDYRFKPVTSLDIS